MRIPIIRSMLVVLAASSGLINANAEVDQRCVSVQTSTCNSILTQCQCTSSDQKSDTDSPAEHQRRCSQTCHEAYQKCLADATRSCYR